MNLFSGIINYFALWLDVLRVQIHVAVVLLRKPTLTIQRPSVWRYNTIKAIEVGEHVSVGPFTEIIVFSKSKRSAIPGKLILGKGSILAAGCNIRAAGGVISIGVNSGVGQNSVLVAANHAIAPDLIYLRCDWDEVKTGVTIGDNCWIAANCVILPGVTIGNNSVIGAGSVVNKSVPADEIWAGVPARLIKKIT